MSTIARLGGQQTGTDATVYQFNTAGGSAVPIGPNVDGQKLAFYCIARGITNNLSIQSCTVDGVIIGARGSATQTNGSIPVTSAIRGFTMARSALPDPTQEDVDLSFTCSTNCIRAAVEAHGGVDWDEVTPLAVVSAGNNVQNPVAASYDCSINVLQEGIILACLLGGDATSNPVYTGLTNGPIITFETFSTLRSGLLSNSPLTESPHAASATFATQSEDTILVISFSPSDIPDISTHVGGPEMYWTPSGSALLLTQGSVVAVVTADGQIEGVALFVNAGTTAGLVSLASVSASAGDLQLVPVAAGGSLYIAFGAPLTHAFVTGASSMFAQAGYSLK